MGDSGWASKETLREEVKKEVRKEARKRIREGVRKEAFARRAGEISKARPRKVF